MNEKKNAKTIAHQILITVYTNGDTRIKEVKHTARVRDEQGRFRGLRVKKYRVLSRCPWCGHAL